MRVRLERIVMFNFKSFKGEVIIGSIKPFTAIIGANGSGKSNIMDAISFVMGEKTRSLRVKQLSELIYGASIGKPIARRAYVTATFVYEDNSSKTFTRSICGTVCEYKVDDQVVTVQSYLSELENLHLNVKAKNFLMFQGTVESTVMKTPKEYVQMFEEISNTTELKVEYERLKDEMFKAENEVQYMYKKRKDLFMKKKYALLEKNEADKYEELHDEYLNVKMEMQLFELFHIQKDIEGLKVILNDIELKIGEYENDKTMASALLKQEKKQLQMLLAQSENIEKDLPETEAALKQKELSFTEVQEKMLYWQQKVNSANSLVLHAEKSNAVHIKTITELKTELMQIEEMKIAFETDMATQLLSQGSSVELNEIQVEEYSRLKQIAEIQSYKNIQICTSLKREESIHQDKLDNENRKQTELESKLHQKMILKDEMEKRIKRYQESIQETESVLTDKINRKYNLEDTIINQKNGIKSLQYELQYVSEELTNAKIDKYTITRLNKQTETIKILQSLFPGVYGRIYNICKSIDSRYDIAMTKVFGKYCHSIIVSTNKVAVQCICYLKEQKTGIETFLPLESLKAKPIKETLRGITEPRNVKLLFDVLKFSPKEIENAILFVTNNVLVCETAEDARMLAYDINQRSRYNCVALDGTYYTKSGIISGGQIELIQKAKIWQEQDIIKMKSKKMMIMEKLQKRTAIPETESDINTLDIQIHSIKSRLNYCRLSLNDAETKLTTLQKEIELIENELEVVNNNITTIKNIMEMKHEDIMRIEGSITNIEDAVFGSFCRNIGISNIQRYEQGHLRFHQEQTNRRMQLDEQCNRIKNLLEFEISRDTRSAVSKVKKNLKNAKRQLAEIRKDEASRKINFEEELSKLNDLQAMYNQAKTNVDEQKKSVSECRHRISVIAKLIIDVQKKHIMTAMKIEKKRAECHAILKNSKTENITIPLLSDNGSTQNSVVSYTTSTAEAHDVEVLSRIDFTTLPADTRSRAEESINVTRNKHMSEIRKLQNKMKTFENPNFKADEKVHSIKEKLKEMNVEYQQAHHKATTIKKQFETVKKQRCDRFVRSLEHVTAQVDIIYKSLVNDDSVYAVLLSDNPEEPYLGCINYSCIVPGKRFQPLSNLSGGERTLAALALLFAIHSYRPAPFFILDEVDAALDNVNIKHVVRYIRSKTDEMGFVIISLKEQLYSRADALVGICSSFNGGCPESLVYTLSLKEYL